MGCINPSVYRVDIGTKTRPQIPFFSLLNSSVTRPLWIVAKAYPVKREQNPFSFS